MNPVIALVPQKLTAGADLLVTMVRRIRGEIRGRVASLLAREGWARGS